MLTGKEDDKVSLLAGDMTIYISDPKSFTRKPLQWDVKLIHKKSIAHEYAYGKWTKRVSNTIHNSLKNDIF